MTIKKTLLLVFIHGFKVFTPHSSYLPLIFDLCLATSAQNDPSPRLILMNVTNLIEQGDDNTFSTFPQHLADQLAILIPHVNVVPRLFPAFETRGELPNAVAAFRDWLQNVVIDLEVEAGTPSPTVAPSVHVVLCGHSMGGIVAADALLSIAGDTAVGVGGSDSHSSDDTTDLLFPDILGVLAFDTPYLGIAPSVLAHGAEDKYRTASTVYSGMQSMGVFGTGTNATKGATAATNASAAALSNKAPLALPPVPDIAGGTSWQKWGKMALYAGAAAAVAAGSAAAYKNREAITEGVSWATSHLEFVGCLMRPEDLRKRVAKIEGLSTSQEMTKFEGSKDPRMQMMAQQQEKNEKKDPLGRVGWMCLYTKLGKAALKAQGSDVNYTGTLMGTGKSGRTFCNLPKGGGICHWKEEVNDFVKDEVSAHMEMFNPAQNPGYEALVEDAKGYVLQWTREILGEENKETAMTSNVGGARTQRH